MHTRTHTHTHKKKKKPETNQEGEERLCLKDPWCVTCLAVYKLCVCLITTTLHFAGFWGFFFSSFAF